MFSKRAGAKPMRNARQTTVHAGGRGRGGVPVRVRAPLAAAPSMRRRAHVRSQSGGRARTVGTLSPREEHSSSREEMKCMPPKGSQCTGGCKLSGNADLRGLGLGDTLPRLPVCPGQLSGAAARPSKKTPHKLSRMGGLARMQGKGHKHTQHAIPSRTDKWGSPFFLPPSK